MSGTGARDSLECAICLELLCEPLQFKGGEAKELWKKKGATHLVTSHRAILLAEALGKTVRSALRPRLVDHAEEHFRPTQCGGLSARGC